jgi:hypothetical protein
LRLQKLLVILLIAASLLPAYYLNKKLQQWLMPRKSFGRFLLFMLAAFALVFLYTFVIVWCITKLFPVAKP